MQFNRARRPIFVEPGRAGRNQLTAGAVRRDMGSAISRIPLACAAAASALLLLLAGGAAVAADPAAPAPVAAPAPAGVAPAAPAAVPVAPPEPGPLYATRTTLDRIGRIVAPVEINGRGPFRFILDTGANSSAISEATALALELVPVDGAVINVHGVTGSATLPVVQVATLRAGELLLENQRLPVLPPAVFAGMDGILGVDALQDARIEVDFGRDRVTIRRSSGRRAPKGFLVVHAYLQNGGLLLVDGQVGRVPVKAIVDTGAERSLGNEALRSALVDGARRPHESVATTVIGATPQIAQGLSFEAPSIDIGGARLNNLTVTFGDLHVFNIWSLLEEPAILIGMDLLGTLEQFVVDYSRREFHLKPVSSGQPTLRRCGGIECNTRIPPPEA
jgi:predicted aspartyl protease